MVKNEEFATALQGLESPYQVDDRPPNLKVIAGLHLEHRVFWIGRAQFDIAYIIHRI